MLVTYGKVVKPVGRTTDGNTLGSHSEWEDFGHENPRARL